MAVRHKPKDRYGSCPRVIGYETRPRVDSNIPSCTGIFLTIASIHEVQNEAGRNMDNGVGLGIRNVCFADEPKDLNCDFENGMDRWRGDGRLREDEKGNRVCMLKKTGTRREEITHKIRLPGNLTFDIH